MSYLFRQQFNISDLVRSQALTPSVVIVEPEIYLARLAGHNLLGRGFKVHYCEGVEILPEILCGVSPRALLINPGVYRQGAAAGEIANISANFPGLVIVTISHNIEAEDLRRLLASGISSHINRKLTRVEDVGEIIRTLIHF